MKRTLQLLTILATITAFAAPALADDRETGTSGGRGAADHAASGADATPETDSGASSDSSSSTSAAPDARQLKELLEAGFEIKSVTLIPAEIVKASGATSAVDAVMILVQHGAELANCYVTFSGFADGSYYNGNVPICTVLK